MIEFAGRWDLVAAAAQESVDTVYDNEEIVTGDVRVPIDEFNRRWLAGEVFTSEPPLTPLTGLTLTITDDSFTETGEADIAWFDEEGVLESEALTFDGTLARSPAGTFLLSEEEGLQTGVFADATDLRLRIDDGDTGITDIITADGDGLLRVMSVVTDELYHSRIRLAYRRV